ncbi:zinc-dependent metalloprotease [Reichenbachiella sp. MALMAid0571]|uniref:zinc-dependent metalloprotease n=1 Tax=Reichenbachiella sp. MALMAid0571 TaxID=3143939 RepID=UPI0032DE5696
MKNKVLYLIGLVLVAMIVATPDVEAQKKKKKKDEAAEKTTTEKKEDKGPKKVADAIKKHEAIDGLFTFYRDSTSGSLKILIKEDQFDKEYIHFYYFENGIVEGRMNKGSFRGSQIFKIRKYYDKIEFVSQNTSLYFDPENPLSRAADANISNAIMFSGKIEAGSPEEGQYLIKADALFLKDVLGVIDVTAFSKDPKAFKLGGLSSDKTKYVDIRNYEENSDVVVEYTFDNKKPNPIDTDAITDSRYISVQVQHSFIAVPENNYQARIDDPRVGYFTTKVTDMTTKEAVPYMDLVHRWNLEKKDKNATLSEPVEPITWWIENTTPYEFRDAIKKGVLAWNKAFEQAGFKNAMAVKVQPDTATWDAGDINYNVLRWTSSANPPFGGYGPSFVNPRTGQILGADIMLEFVHHTNRVKYDKLFNITSGYSYNTYEISSEELTPELCSMGYLTQSNTLFGQALLMAEGASKEDLKGMQEESMIALTMHEVGHTLGLNHNMKASQRFTPEQLADKNFIKGKCLTGSVMDYTAINLTLGRSKQGQYYDVAVGPYDKWAIEFGYSVVNTDDELEKILSKSTDPELIFGNDADDMRSAGKAIDPRVMIGDLSNDQISYSIDRFKIVNNLMGKIKEKYSVEGKSYQELTQAFSILSGQYAIAGRVISRFIGGVYVDRSMVGQQETVKPYTPVAYADQKRAMNALSEYIFSPDAYAVPSELYNYMALQRRGFNFFSGPEDPKLHARVLSSQKDILSHILHVNTLQRISDSELYGNKYSLSEYMADLNNAIFKADAYKSVNSFRQNLQIEYVKRLIGIIDAKSAYTNMAKSMALYNLKSIKKTASSAYGDTASKAHRQHIAFLIDKALDQD